MRVASGTSRHPGVYTEAVRLSHGTERDRTQNEF